MSMRMDGAAERRIVDKADKSICTISVYYSEEEMLPSSGYTDSKVTTLPLENRPLLEIQLQPLLLQIRNIAGEAVR